MTKDAKLWGPDVDEFKPERFLDENGNFKNDWWDFTFGTGKYIDRIKSSIASQILYMQNI